MQESLALPAGRNRLQVPPNTYAIGVDPGMTSALGVVTVTRPPVLVAATVLKRCEAGPLDVIARARAIEEVIEGRPCGMAVEDMPGTFFKSRSAGQAFRESHTRWIDAGRALSSRIIDPIAIHVSTWRKATGVQALARTLPRLADRPRPDTYVVLPGAAPTLRMDGCGHEFPVPRGFRPGRKVSCRSCPPLVTKRLDYKAAAVRWVKDRFGYEAADHNEAEAICVANTLAVQMMTTRDWKDARRQSERVERDIWRWRYRSRGPEGSRS